MKNTYIKDVFRGICFVFGVFLLALTYNLFLEPNNLVVGGMSGLALIFHKLFGWNSTIFIYVTSFSLLIASYVFLGKEQTSNTVIGSILYPLMVTITSPIASYILSYSDVDEFLIIVGITSILYGASCGIIYKTGFTTGGGDVIMQLLSKYAGISTSKANFVYSFIIIFLSGCVFGMASFINAIIILVISNIVINKIICGISDSKVFFICSHKLNDLKDLIKDEFDSGFTVLASKSGFLHKKGEVIMVVVPTRSYYSFKNKILEVDPDAFFIINDCYEVTGGVRKRNIPWFN